MSPTFKKRLKTEVKTRKKKLILKQVTFLNCTSI